MQSSISERLNVSTLNWTRFPLDDAKTYKLFTEGQTLGVFQFESSGMRDTLRKAKPQRFDDLIALNALYRPGPLRGGVIDEFIARKHGKTEIKYTVPQLEPVLKDTYGVIAYQEQVMRIASDLGGFTMGEADVLRKAMGKKRRAGYGGPAREIYLGEQSIEIFRRVRRQKYSISWNTSLAMDFNKSHSTAYALLAYQTAYLKANYPSHFLASLLTIESQNTDKLALYLGECRDLGIKMLPPDINRSQFGFTVTDRGLRFGLSAIKNVGEAAILSILKAREQCKAIRSLNALTEQVEFAPCEQARPRKPCEVRGI